MIEVSTWEQLIAELSAKNTEDKGIALSSDIIIEEDIQRTVTRLSNAHTIIIHGNGHKIQSLYCDRNIIVFNGHDYRKMIFQDIFFDSVRIESGMLFRDVTLERCQISCELIDSQLNYGVRFDQCGLNIIGYGTNSSVSLSNDRPTTKSNIEVHGVFKELGFTLDHSYLRGRCAVIDKLSFDRSKMSFIDTEVLTEKAEVTARGSTFTVYNKSKTKGLKMPSEMIGISTQQFYDATYLRSIGYPIRLR